uniref:CARD domain-containing protein n=1 Tax=Magallana gigas TaxID=29159 RepID=K1QZT7_MAGGI
MGDSYEPYLQTSDIQDLTAPRLGSLLSSGFYEDVIVRRNYILLKDELSVGWIHDFLLQHEVLSQRDLEDICSGLRPRHVQVDTLLKLLLRHGRSACSKLIQILPDCGYNHILDVFHETTNFKTKEDWMKYQSEIRVHHIEMEHSFLSKTIEPVSTADFVLQELEEDAYSIDDHDQVMNEVSKSRQSKVLLRQVVNYDGVVLNCFLCAVDQIRHILPGTSILKRLENANLAKGKGRKKVGVYFQDEHLVTVVDLNYDDERRDHVIILKFGNQKKRATQELENVLVRRIQCLDTEIDELANRFMHMSIQDGQAGSVVIYVKALTDSAAENVNKHHLKAFIQKVLQDPEVNRLLPVGTFNIQVETITSGFVKEEVWKIDRDSLTEILTDNRPMLEDELEPFCFLRRFQQDQIFSQDEIESIRKHGSRRYRANEFLRLLQAKGDPAMEVFMDEMRRRGDSYMLRQLIPSSPSTQCKECVRGAILDNYEGIRDEIDVRVTDYTDPSCHSAHALYKDSSERYRSPQALLKHVLECETALMRFLKVIRSTPIAKLTQSDCTCQDNPHEKEQLVKDVLPAHTGRSPHTHKAVSREKPVSTKKFVLAKTLDLGIERVPLTTFTPLIQRFPTSKTKPSKQKNSKTVKK